MESPHPQSTEWIAGKTRGKYWDKVGTPVGRSASATQLEHKWNTTGTHTQESAEHQVFTVCKVQGHLFATKCCL